jgi:hypothetical protein
MWANNCDDFDDSECTRDLLVMIYDFDDSESVSRHTSHNLHPDDGFASVPM